MIRIISILATLLLTLPMLGQEYSIRFFDDSDGMSQWHITRVQQDKNGMIWLSTWNGLNRFDGTDFDCFKVQPGDGNDVISDRIRDFIIDKDGTFLCRVDETIFRFNPHTCKFTSVNADVQRRTLARMEKDRVSQWGIPHDVTFGETTLKDVHHEFRDRQGITWLVGHNGFYRVMKRQMPFQYVDEVPRETVRSMFRDREGHIWIGSKNNEHGEVSVFDAKMNLLGHIGTDGRLHKEHTPFCDIFTIYQDSYGQIWMGSKPGGLFRINEKLLFAGKPAMEHIAQNQTIYDVKQDPKGRLWVAMFDHGLYIISNPQAAKPRIDNVMAEWGSKYPKECDKVRRILFHDNLLLATTTAGLLVIEGTQGNSLKAVKIHRHYRESNRPSSLSNSATMDILFDRQGHLVVTTESGGINIMESGKLTDKQLVFRHITEMQGLNSDVVHSAMQLGNDLLLQTNIGLVKLSGNYDHPLCFGSSFWNADFRFSDARPVMLDGGRLLISLEKGAITVPVTYLTGKGYVPRIALTRIIIPEDTTLWGADDLDTLRLKPAQRNVTIKFAAIDYTSEGDIRYATRLMSKSLLGKNDSAKWTIASTSREITLFDLNPGTYTFQIRSTNAAGMWVDNYRTITILVEPRFIETTFAHVLIFLIIAAIIAGITYTLLYIRTIKRQQKETLEAYLSLLEASKTTPFKPQNESLSETKPAESDSEPAPIAGKEPAPVVLMSPEDDAFMQRLVKFVDENIGNSDVGVDEMASATATSRSSLNRRMKSIVGVTPADFLKEARMKRASQLLRNTTMSTTEIAYACGFSDPKYFSKCFKATTGKSPRQYKDELQD